MNRGMLFVLCCVLLLAAGVGADFYNTRINVPDDLLEYFFDRGNDNRTGMYVNGPKEDPHSLLDEGTTDVPQRYASEKSDQEEVWDGKTHSGWAGKRPVVLGSSQSDMSIGIFGIFLNQPEQEVRSILGHPQRIDKSALGYDWWIYNQDYGKYVQVGIRDRKVVDIYSNAPSWEFDGLKAGSATSELAGKYQLKEEVSFTYDSGEFTLQNNLAEKPLVMAKKGQPVIFYLDRHDAGKITAIRALTMENLVKANLYAMNVRYYGRMPDMKAPALPPSEQALVDQGNERQIFDLANVVRMRNQLPALAWNEEAAMVARGHSRDMMENHYFHHVSKTTGLTPFERLKRQGIRYRMAAENIATGYFDGIEAHEGWMNSEGHRKNILEKGLKTLGVGVVGKYYTQNFVTY